MLGISDPWVLAAYLLVPSGALLCAGYGIFKWNKEGQVTMEEIEEEKTWIKEELEIEEELAGEEPK
ncbi:MAG: symporter small accessory protein [Spirochaetales bacterium]